MKSKVSIKEIFESVQGEGLYIGANQLFIRFSKCNLNCSYCDTDFKNDLKEYSVTELLKEIENYKNIHSISLTGGEPLLESEFLKDLLPSVKSKIYLETNGTLHENLKEIINYTDIISMDIKLPSATHSKDLFSAHEKFIKIAIDANKEIFLKTVFNENITEEEIEKTIALARKYNLTIVLQPETQNDKISLKTAFIYNTFEKFVSKYDNIRLIPQTHKFLNIR